MGIHILWDQTLFQPLEPIGAQGFCQTHGVFNIKRHPAIKHQFAIVADLFTPGNQDLSPAGLVGSVIGAIVALLVWRAVADRRAA